MIDGLVSRDCEAVVPVLVRGVGLPDLLVECVLDTGFSGFLALPPDLVRRLDLPWERREWATLADGSTTRFNAYEAILEWVVGPVTVQVDCMEAAPLIGMSLLRNCRIEIDAVPDGIVKVSRL